MPLKLRFEPEADQDLASIAEWIVLNADPETGRGYVARILARCRKMIDRPHGGRLRRRGRRPIYSVPFERSALVLYRVTHSEIIVVRVLRRGRDPERLLRGSR